jgi:hypothetical protein
MALHYVPPFPFQRVFNDALTHTPAGNGRKPTTRKLRIRIRVLCTILVVVAVVVISISTTATAIAAIFAAADTAPVEAM